MSYIAKALEVKNDWWRYLVGSIIVLIGIGIFSMPHSIAIGMKQMSGEVDFNRLNDVSYLLGLFDSNISLLFILLPFLGGLIALLIVVKSLHKQSITKITTSRAKIDWSRFWFSFLFWGIFSSAMVALGYYLAPEEFEISFQLIPFLILALISILLVPIQTSFEEYFFRGYLMQFFGVLAKNRWVPLVLTSVMFGLMHFANPEVDKLGPGIMVYYIGTGFFLGIITLMDEGLELALGFHAANNLFTALLVTADWTAFQTYSILTDTSEPSITYDAFLPVIIIYPIILFIFSKKYGWINWKNKLTGGI
ncbi:CPBP family intramembrane metalloprotease [Urechidicola sp. KH5]